MEAIWAFIWDWRFVIIVIISVFFKFLLDRQGFYTTLYNLMLQAKRLAKDGVLKTGKAQEDWVVEKAMVLIPASWKLFFGEAQVRNLVRILYQKGMDILDDGKLNNSY